MQRAEGSPTSRADRSTIRDTEVRSPTVTPFLDATKREIENAKSKTRNPKREIENAKSKTRNPGGSDPSLPVAPQLRGGKNTPPKPISASGGSRIASAAASGDRLAALRALRDRLAVDVDECRSARDVSALSQRLMDVLEQIAGLADAAGAGESRETGLSDFEKRLREREQRAAASRRAKGG